MSKIQVEPVNTNQGRPCHSVTTIGIVENEFGSAFKAHPNPTHGKVTVELGNRYSALSVFVKDLSGQVISTRNIENTKKFDLKLKGKPGYYLIEIIGDKEKKALLRVLKE